jgi:GNAT superfamily N-acetyltransferase
MATLVRALQATEVSAVTAALPGLPFAPRNKHKARLELQRTGRAVYLIAWLGGEPAGHVLVHLSPRSEQGAAVGCAELEDLFVREEARGRGVGRALIAEAEAAAVRSGATGLGCGVSVANPDNAAARRLYEQCGYTDPGLEEFMLGYTYWDELGEAHRDEEPHRYLAKPLS